MLHLQCKLTEWMKVISRIFAKNSWIAQLNSTEMWENATSSKELLKCVSREFAVNFSVSLLLNSTEVKE